MRIYTVESLRVPEEGSSTQGKSGPKVRPKGVADGYQVKNPGLPSHVVSELGTQEEELSVQEEKHVLRGSEIRVAKQHNPH